MILPFSQKSQINNITKKPRDFLKSFNPPPNLANHPHSKSNRITFQEILFYSLLRTGA